MGRTGNLVLLLTVAAADLEAAEDRLEEVWCVEYNAPVRGGNGGRAIAVDGAGNFTVLGHASSPETHFDYLTLKYDPDGNLLWMARHDGNGEEERPAGIAAAADGSVYITGSSRPNRYTTDIVTIKYDAQGTNVWVACYDNPDEWDDDAVDIGVDAAGNVIVAGDTFREATGSDFLTIKYDAAGNQLWTSTLVSTVHDNVYALAVDPAGSSYVTGTLDWKATTVKYDPDGREMWVARSDGIIGSDMGLDGAGNVYVSGALPGESWFLRTIKYDPDGRELWAATGPEVRLYQQVAMVVDATGCVFVAPDSGGGVGTDDLFLVSKYDTDGSLLWEVRRPNSGTTGLALDGAGGVLACGSTFVGNTAYVATKYDAETGKLLWDRTYDGPGSPRYPVNDAATAVAVLPSGAAVVTGMSWDDCGGCSEPSVSCTTVAYDAEGNRLWVARDSGLGNRLDRCAGLVLDPRGGMYVFGFSQDDFGRTGYLTMKYDGDGKQIWLARETEAGRYLSPSAAASDPAGNICVTGSAGDPGDHNRFLTLKYDPDGRRIWRAYYEAGESSRPSALAVGGDGSVVVTGKSSYTSGDEGAAVKYDADGKLLWAVRMGGVQIPDPGAVALDASGNAVVTGWAPSGTSGSTDFATVKYAPDGRLLWEARYHGTAYNHLASAVAVDAAGFIILAGVMSGTSSDDCAIVKYDPDGQELWARLQPVRSAAPIALVVDAAGNAHIAGGGGVVAKYDPDGNLLWSTGRQEASLVRIALGPQGDVFAGGSFLDDSNPQGDSCYASLLLRYDPAGNLVGEASHPLRVYWQFLTAGLAVGSSLDVYLAGTSEDGNTAGDFVLLKYTVEAGLERPFVRGDCDGDGKLGIGDAVFHLEASFRTGRELPCDEACDTNGDGRVIAQVADPVYLLRYLFLGAQAPPPPFPECGPGPDAVLSCRDHAACP